MTGPTPDGGYTDLGHISCPDIVTNLDGAAEMRSTLLTEFSGTVVAELSEFNPGVIEALAAAAGVFLPPDRPCKAWRSNQWFSVTCCRSAHTDPWHIDGRWPTTPWREDDVDNLAAGVEVTR